MRIAVFGASGTIGSALLPLLVREHEVIAVSRRAHTGGEADIRWVTADVTNPTSVDRALEGVDVVVYLVHSLGHSDFAARDRRAAAMVARAERLSTCARSCTWAAWGTSPTACPNTFRAAATPSDISPQAAYR